MRRRKHPTDPTSDAAFESHLSTVTKLGLGMLILITMATTFSSSLTLAQPKFKRHQLGAPVITAAPENAKSVAFECRGDRIFPFEFDILRKDGMDFLNGPRRGANMEQLAQKYNATDYAHHYYTFEFQAKSGDEDLPNEPAILCRPKAGSLGETLAELKKSDSVFGKRLQTLDKNKDVVVLRVWSDSFGFFRDLRDWLQSEGYQISWHPVDQPLQRFHPDFYGGDLEFDK